jgi:PAS domain S-box-containing protein
MLENLRYIQKIIFFIIAVFLLTAVSLVYIYSYSKKDLIREHHMRLEKTSHLTTNMLKRNIENVEKTINLFRKNQNLIEYCSTSGRPAQYLLEELTVNIIEPLNLRFFEMYDKSGAKVIHLEMGNPRIEKDETDIKNLPYLHRDKILSGVMLSRGTLRIISIGLISLEPAGGPDNALSYIKLGADITIENLNSIKKQSGNDIFIIKDKNILLSTQEGIESFKITDREMEAGDTMYSIISLPLKSINGEEIGSLLIALSQKDLAAALKKLKLTILFIALGSLFISCVLGVILIKTITAPLSRLVRLTEQVGVGKFPEETTFKGGDEISVLGRHFLEMIKKLKDQKKALDSYTTGLEDAVMKRTQELFHSKEEWVRTFNSITDYVLLVDRDFNILKANRVLLDRLNLNSQELSGKKCFEIFCGRTLPPEKCAVRETLADGKPSIIEIKYSNLDGHFMATASPLTSEKGDITGVVYVVKDITEYHNIQLQMANAEKLASLGQMAAGFAHEINNPMSSIAGCAELLIDQLESDELKKIPQHDYFYEYLHVIYREAFRCRDIIRGMLRFSRKHFEKSIVEVNTLLKEVISLLDYSIRIQKIRIVEDYRGNINSLLADEGEIRQIFLALIVNAIDAMPDGGTLAIKTQDSDGNIRITIKDTGAGIPPEIRNRIFEPFFTTKEVGKGTGLGLFIVFNLLKKYNGKIELESTDSTGSAFTVTFPAVPYTQEVQE